MKSQSRRTSACGVAERAGRAEVGSGQVVESLERRALMSADLTVGALSIDEASASAGSEIHTQFTYTNLGDAFGGPWNIELRLSSDDVWGNADDIVLAVEREDEDLESGQSSTERESVIVPGGTAAGTYRLGVFIDSSGEITENSESNNIAFGSDTIVISGGGGGGGGGVNLTVGEVSGALESGEDEIVVSYTYTNTAGAFNGFFDQEFRLSLNEVWGDADDIVLGVEREVEDLVSGQSSAENESWALPAGIEPGAYHVAVMVDSTAAVTETNESDNIAWSVGTVTLGGGGGGGGGGVDLTLRGVVANPTPRPVGEDAEVGWVIVNAGGSFNGGFDQEVRLSLDNVWGNADDIVLGIEREIEDFEAGQSSEEDESFVIPAGTASGSYYVAVRIDSSGEVTESDEGNNIAFSAEPVVTVGSGGGGSGGRLYSIFGSGRHIEDDDVSPRRDDSTAYGLLRVDGRVRESEFEIHNFGSTSMEIERVEIEGRNRRDFVIAVAPGTTLAPGESTMVVVRFDPSKGGVRNARLVIDTSRDTTNAYEFKLKGIGAVPRNAPDATVIGRGGSLIRDDDLSAGGGDGTRFRTLEVGGTQERTFTLRNDGQQTLVLTTPMVRVTGAGSGAFTIVSMPAGSLAPGASTTFTVRFAPGAASKHAANIEVLSNDPDEEVFNFRVVGRGE